ncbi:hypothetical protein [Streptomyces sp. NPDC060131]|uniref:hypothetical protein n=1 Tax=unclassified Streptomyces TaxID=2593676 RepID=UPI0036597A9B
MRPTVPSGNALLLANLAAAYMPAPGLVRIIADTLQAAGEIPADRALKAEDLYMACQYLGAQKNIDVRHRGATGKRLAEPLREPVAWALCQMVSCPPPLAPRRTDHRNGPDPAPGAEEERERIRGRLAVLVS